MKQRKLAVVDWADSCSLRNLVWYREDQIPATVIDVNIRTIGYEIRKNAMEIVLSMSRSEDYVSEPFGIPMGCIKKIQYIRQPK